MNPDALRARGDNDGVLAYLRLRNPGTPVVGPHPDEVDRWELGTDPDIVGRLWDELAPSLGEDGRLVIHGRPALVDPRTADVLAVGLGTEYALRLAPDDFASALAAGGRQVVVYGEGTVLDVGADFGSGWLFGSWDAREAEWLSRSGQSG